MNSKALVTTPNSDSTTRYISVWAEETINKLKAKNLQFIALKNNKATRSVLESMVKKHSPSLVFLNGHGSPDFVCGQNNEVLLQAGQNDHLLRGFVAYALSCSSAKQLGPAAVANGALAYIGYVEDFIFFISPEKIRKPLEDKTAEMFLAPANHVVVSLAKGHTAGEATNAAKGYFLKNIQKMLSSEASVDEREYIRYLIWDMRALICKGNTNATVVEL